MAVHFRYAGESGRTSTATSQIAPRVTRASLASACGAACQCIPRTVPARALYDTLTWASLGFSPAAANSVGHHSRAKNPRSSACGSASTNVTPGSSVGVNRTSHHPHVRDRYDEPPAGLAVRRLLGEDLLREIPGEQQAVVRPPGRQLLRRDDRQPGARREPPLLHRAPVGYELDQVPADSEVVQERTALG